MAPEAICDICKHIYFDDSVFREPCISTHGARKTLKFGRNRETYPVPSAINDSLPDLPAFSRSAQGGCELCAYVRTAILNAGISHCGDIECRPSFVWGKLNLSDDEPEGLLALVIKIYAQTEGKWLSRLGCLKFSTYRSESMNPILPTLNHGREMRF